MYDTILCATDLNVASKEAVIQAVQIAHQFGAKIIMLNVHEEFMSKEEMAMLRVSIQKIKGKFQKVALDAKDEMKSFINNLHAEHVDIEYKLMEGDPSKIICKEAMVENVDLIIMGVSEKNALTDFIFNSTASYVIENVNTPVLVVPIKNN